MIVPTYSTTHGGIERIIAGSEALLGLLNQGFAALQRGTAVIGAAVRTSQQARAEQAVLRMLSSDPRLLAEYRAAMLRAERDSAE